MSTEDASTITDQERARRNAVVRELLAKLDRHAPGERAHGERVAVYSVAVGERLGMNDANLLTLRYAAELHDIGKLLIDSELLMSARPLEPHERALVEKHVEMAANVLPSDDSFEPAKPLIYHHHERWAGGGYPTGKSGDAIPLGARIIAASEALDVMLEGAPWRQPFPEDAARAGIAGLSGTWYDPSVVDALLQIQPLIQPIKG